MAEQLKEKLEEKGMKCCHCHQKATPRSETERKQFPQGHIRLFGKQKRDSELRSNLNTSGEGGGSSMQLVKLIYGCV